MTSEERELYTRLLEGALDRNDKLPAVVSLLLTLVQEWKVNARDVYMGGRGKTPGWLEFEFRTWELGEKIRQALRKRPSWRKDEAFLGAVSQVAFDDAELGRGREPFVELVGRLDGENNRSQLLDLLSESAIAGHAVGALRLGRVQGASEIIKEMLKHERRGWVKREMEKYLASLA